MAAESGRFFFYPLRKHKAVAAVCPHSAILDHYSACSPLPNLHQYGRIVPECVAGWSPSEQLEQVDSFYENQAYTLLMHQVVRKWAHLDSSVRLRARATGTGWVHVVDERGLPCMRYSRHD